ncbi:hypothetical protein ABIF64_000388 [Bradyrhizobium japonicum]|uniref:AraC family transcriptional regulator n=1 Tax=Bradyrhizobium japonicum TaxID=375 RepID=A0ABV2RKY9_BRAJP|nr:hypothetical protein [Bradyrhizobium japonicum]MCP1793257.1 hypothetical protein [Bradyrhizobium japonicum]MCP1805690.1 hypothetical protein [Bradyrhizobium japonicum]MCP1814707.1 hypothetical protein [Bradyrhizobium japonicum]MCP1873864.1 hypothetical protein [Bradyrhizobium japonicum]
MAGVRRHRFNLNWKYDFILVHGRYIVLRPRTHEIVYIIEG